MSALSPVHAKMFIVDVLVLAEAPPPVSWVADCVGGHVRRPEWLLVVLRTRTEHGIVAGSVRLSIMI